MKKCLLLAGLIAGMCVLGCANGFVQAEEKSAASQAGKSQPAKRVRVVCIGDSITDGNTYPQIVMQAFADAGMPVPAMICGGVVSNVAAQMAARFDPFLDMKPDIVTFSAGTNDSLRNVTPEEYEKALRSIADKCKARNINMILLTPCAINVGDTNKPNADAEALGEKFAEILRAVARENGWAVAEVSALQKAARAKGETIMAGDGIHPDYHGQSLMARAILDAMGHQDIPAPTAKEFSPILFPGVVSPWLVQAAPKDEKGKQRPMTDEELAAHTATLTAMFGGDLARAKTPVTVYPIPEMPRPDKDGKFADAGVWMEQERRNGFATNIREIDGGPLRYWGAAVKADAEKKAFISTAIGVRRVWLNGALVYTHPMNGGEEKWTGYHAGKERLPVTLKKGVNLLLVEHSNNEFFVSVTDKLVWEEDYAAALEKAAKK